jgi:hypothetical protein
MSFTLHSTINVTGFVTLKKFIAGKNLQQIESLLGFHQGRLRQGATIAELHCMPAAAEFDLAGYSQVADHRFDKGALNGFDQSKLKGMVQGVWSQPGEKLVKIIATTRHDPNMTDDDQYPPGQGVPQWKLIAQKPATVTAILMDYSKGVYKG